MNKNKKLLQSKLEEKLKNEFSYYKSELLKESKEMIFEQSYQTNIREQIKNFLIEISYHYSADELNIICNTEDLLGWCYHDWIMWDSPFSTDLEESTFESIGKTITREKEKHER